MPDVGKKNFTVFLSHDIDRVVNPWFHSLYYFLLERRFYHLKSFFQKENLYWTFDKIMNLESKYNVKSTFFFLNEKILFNICKPKTWKLALGRYNIFDSNISKLIRTIDKRGWEIGLHGSYFSYNNKSMLFQEKLDLEKVLGKKIYGVRQHYLNLEIPKTWEIQSSIGFLYDATYGFKRDVGYLENKFLPFKPLENNFVVITLTLMDGNLFNNCNLKQAWQKCLKLIDFAEKNHAVLSILWHNNYFNQEEYPGYLEIYEKILQECQSRNALFKTGYEVANLYKK